MHKFDPAKAEKLLSPDRYHQLKPDVLLEKLGVAPGGTILDLGCGNGFFTFPASAAMGEDGMVIAADMSEEMLQLLKDRNPRDNVQVLQVEEVRMDVDTESVDGAVLINLYHEFNIREENVRELKRVLKPAGKLMVIDRAPEEGDEAGPPNHHRVALETAKTELEQWGFEVSVNDMYTEDSWIIIAQREE